MRRRLILMMSLLCVAGMLLVGCGEASIEKVEGDGAEGTDSAAEAGQDENTDSGDADAAEDEKDEETSQTEEFAVGDTVDFDGVHITLTNVRESEGGEFDEPENDRFILVELDIQNKTDEAVPISTMLQMKLMDAEGYEQDQTIMIDDVKGNLDAEVSPGKNLKGEIPFDADESEFYEFIFEDPFATGQAIWRIEPDDIQ